MYQLPYQVSHIGIIVAVSILSEGPCQVWCEISGALLAHLNKWDTSKYCDWMG